MATSSLVQARIETKIKEKSAAVLASMGLTHSDAVRLLLVKIAHDEKFPFEPWKPNEKTIKAMTQARKRKGKSFKTVGALMADLNADD